MWKIQLFKLNYDEREVDAVRNVVSGGWLSMGEKTQKFELEFSKFIGHNTYSTAVSNGTAALHMALIALDVGVNDEVIIPALTFVADINVVNIVGAKAVLADSSSLDNWNVSLKTIKEKVTDKTKAIIVVHYAGYPIKDIKEIAEFCSNKGIGLIEDVAHAPGAKVGGQSCGTFGDFGCYSFFSNKNLSIGEGGMVTSQNIDSQKKIGYIRSHGMTSLTLDRHKGRSTTYDVVQPGLNYRMDEMRSAIGLVQLDKLAKGNKRRGKLTERYRKNFKDSEIKIPYSSNPNACKSVYHILPILLPKEINRIDVISELKNNGIQSSIHYPPFWGFSGYREKYNKSDFPITGDICDRQLTLPLFPTMTDKEVDTVTDVVLNFI